MMISLGKGMQADSMAMERKIPQYPIPEMTAIMKVAKTEIIFSIIYDSVRAPLAAPLQSHKILQHLQTPFLAFFRMKLAG